MIELYDQLLAIHEALDHAHLPHAFGGAIALAYCTKEPRGTRDLDINVFVDPERSDDVLDALPPGLKVGASDRKRLRQDGQIRVVWDRTPVDIFLNTTRFHTDVARRTLERPFEGTTIRVLDCVTLMVFKAMYGRSRDWADIEEMLAAGVQGRGALNHLSEIVGSTHPATMRLAELVRAD